MRRRRRRIKIPGAMLINMYLYFIFGFIPCWYDIVPKSEMRYLYNFVI
jgi:hypothetical protein